MKLQIVHLQAFLAVAETLSFTAAARSLHVAPSRLSHRIQEAEAELGAPLFRRTTRRTSLTPAGKSLLPRAEAIMRELNTIEAIFRTGIASSVRLGVRSLPSDFRDRFISTVLAPALRGCSVAPQPLDSDRQLKLLRSCALDFALVWRSEEPSSLLQLPVLEEEMGVAVPATGRFLALDAVSPRDLVGLRLAATVDPLRFPADIAAYLEMLPLVDRVNPAVEDGLALLLSGGEHCAFLPLAGSGHTFLRDARPTQYVMKPLTRPARLITYFTWRADQEPTPHLRPAIAAVQRAFPEPEVR